MASSSPKGSGALSSAQGKEYLAFVASPADLPEGEPICLFIKDLTPGPRKYEGRLVRAVVSPVTERLPGSDKLFLSSLGGRAYPHTLAINIIEEMGEYVSGSPYSQHVGFFYPGENKPG